MATAKKTGGAKTTRSETVTVRLDPELRYLAEIASRIQRRTLSSYIEWAIQDSLNRVAITEGSVGQATVADNARSLWDVDEADRFAKLGIHAPHLLNYDEQKLWKLIRENGWLWRGIYNEFSQKWEWRVEESQLVFKRLRDKWEVFKAVAYEGLDPDALPTWEESPFTKGDTTDDGIPF